MFLIGIVISVLCMKFNKKIAYFLTLVSVVLGFFTFTTVYKGNVSIYMHDTVSSGIIMGYLAYFIVTMFLCRIVNIKPKFNNFYIKKAIVVKKGATNYSGSTGTITNGTFGGLDVQMSNYNYDIDTLFVVTEDRKVLGLNGIGNNNLAQIDDKIMLAGYGSIPETLFLNVNNKKVYKSKILGIGNALLTAILFSIPFIGHVTIFGIWLRAFNSNSGFVSERTNEYDCAHLFFTFVYATSIFYLVGSGFQSHPDFGILVKQYLWIVLPVFILQYQLMRLDHIRFHKFLYTKLEEAM